MEPAKNAALQILLHKAGRKHKNIAFSSETVKMLQVSVQTDGNVGIILGCQQMNQAGK